MDARGDVFSAGAIVFEMLTGAAPFRVRQGRSTAGDDPVPRLQAPGVPRRLAGLVTGCLARVPVRRPRDGNVLLQRFEAVERYLESGVASGHGAAARMEPAGRSGTLAKLSRPKLQRVFPRERLFRKLDAARAGAAAVWVTGMPGAGKTTLVASWLESRRLRSLWYHVDAGDQDVATFFYYLGQAALAASGRKCALPVFAPEYRDEPAVFARRFFRQLVGQVPRPFALVVDDYQEVPLDSPLHAALREGLQEMPGGATVVVISRSKPPLTLARQRAYGSIAVLASADLKLTPAEARGIAGLHQPSLPVRRVTELAQRTDGWAAGLVLMLEHPEPGDAPRGRGAPQELFDFFASEILERTERTERRVLLETALLPKPTAEMAERLTGVGRAPRILRDLAGRGYFTAGQEEGDAYQYHPLFREFLLARLREELPPARLGELRRSAARLLEEAGQPEQAVELLRDAGGWEDIARIALAQAPALVATGRGATLERWLAAVPEQAKEADPWTLYWLGLARLPSSPPMARRSQERAYELFRAAGDVAGLYQAWAAVVDTFICEWADLRPLAGWIEALEQLRAGHPRLPSPELEGRVTFSAFTALFFRRPDHPMLGECEERLFDTAMAGAAGAQLRVLAGTLFVVVQAMLVGDLERARRVVEAVEPLVRAGGLDPLTCLRWRGAEAAYRWSAGEHVRSRRAVAEGLALARETGVSGRDFLLHFQGVCACLSGDDPEGAARSLRGMAGALDPHARLNVSLHEFASAMVALRLGDWTRSLRHASAAAEEGGAAGCPLAEAFARFCAARALAGTGAVEEAQRELDAARRLSHGIRSGWVAYLSALIQATLALARGEERAALEPMGVALAIGRERGLVNDLWFSREETAELCALALAHGVEVATARKLVARRQCVPGARAMELDSWPWPLELRLLEGVELRRDGEPVRVPSGPYRGALVLLQLLVALGGRPVRREELADLLWPTAPRRVARQKLAGALQRLRRLLGVDGAVAQQGGALLLDRARCFVDVWALERQLARGQALLARSGPQEEGDLARLTARVAGLCRSPFLSGVDPNPSGAAYRARLREQLAGFLAGRVEQLERLGRAQEAMRLASLARAIEPVPASPRGRRSPAARATRSGRRHPLRRTAARRRSGGGR